MRVTLCFQAPKFAFSIPKAPFRIYTLDAPKRLIVEFNAVTFAGLEEEVFSRSQSITGVRAGALKSGWSRMVFDLARPMSVDSAGVTVAPKQRSRN